MSYKHGVANARRWAKIPPEDRKKKMAEVARIKYTKLSLEQKKEIGARLVRVRKEIRIKREQKKIEKSKILK